MINVSAIGFPSEQRQAARGLADKVEQQVGCRRHPRGRAGVAKGTMVSIMMAKPSPPPPNSSTLIRPSSPASPKASSRGTRELGFAVHHFGGGLDDGFDDRFE
ncbi:hypothetical protein [Methylocaldum marinum]|uniref:hypothetical protein n=1 Tax=Methylocaldum marinum TaxID=1432792 RepID=UPI0014761FDA|nr:hypothetical protein [Methylocaldum marinum]